MLELQMLGKDELHQENLLVPSVPLSLPILLSLIRNVEWKGQSISFFLPILYKIDQGPVKAKKNTHYLPNQKS